MKAVFTTSTCFIINHYQKNTVNRLGYRLKQQTYLRHFKRETLGLGCGFFVVVVFCLFACLFVLLLVPWKKKVVPNLEKEDATENTTWEREGMREAKEMNESCYGREHEEVQDETRHRMQLREEWCWAWKMSTADEWQMELQWGGDKHCVTYPSHLTCLWHVAGFHMTRTERPF